MISRKGEIIAGDSLSISITSVMNTNKISLIPAFPPTPSPGITPADQRPISSALAEASSIGQGSASKPVLSSKRRTASPAVETVGPGSRCRASSLTPHGEKLDALAARMLPSLLDINHSSAAEPRSITCDMLAKAVASPLQARDLQKLSLQWPGDLINKNTVTDWTQRLVAACDGVYASRGMQAYIDVVTDLIFDEGNDEAGLPGEIRDLCAMLTKNALQLGIDHGLDRTALQGLRNTVILRFLMANVFVPHLRPTALREMMNDTGLYAFDRQLFRLFCDKTTEIIDIDAEAIVLLAVARQTKQQAQSQTTSAN